MHILIVNDDGPPSPHSSPYVHSLVRELQAAGHVVSVCLPHTQRSWIGKAHMIGQTVKPIYYRPPPLGKPAAGLVAPEGESAETEEENSHGTTHSRPSTRPGTEEWILVDGTPASCVQIGLYHFFKDRGPVDLVVSGPNYGRNTTAVFALSSGTLGGALEAAVCKRRAIALSYAFFSRNHDPVIIAAASRRSVRVIESLWKQWPEDGSVDLYSVNVPLLEGLEEGKVLWTGMLQNYWGDGSCFTEVDGSVDGEVEDEERIREGEGGDSACGGAGEDGPGGEAGGSRGLHKHKHFKWSPRFTDVYKSVEDAPPGNDGWAVQKGHTSVTPLKANFWQAATQLHGGELELAAGYENSASTTAPVASGENTTPQTHTLTDRTRAAESNGTQTTTTQASRQDPHLYAVIDYQDDYVQPLILEALKSLLPAEKYTLLTPPPAGQEYSLSTLLPSNLTSPRVLQITAYESIDFDYATSHSPSTVLVNSYVIRKALIRKHFLSVTVDTWVAKHPDSILKKTVKRAEPFEVDYAEFLDDALIEAFDLRASLERNEDATEEKDKEWWILKPSMSDRGQGIRLFSTMEELQGIFDGWEGELSESDDDEDEEEENVGGKEDGDDDEKDDYINSSHLRHFVAQPYIHPPLLLPELDNRKFHIRVYVLAVGSMKVYVYRDMLALFAAKPYQAPSSSSSSGEEADVDLDAHLTNTCLQGTDEAAKASSVHRFWDLPTTSALSGDLKEKVFDQICEVTGDLFEAAAREMMIHFQPLEQAFEVYGLDFLVDAQGTAWLLEVNAFPDFKQTLGGLKDVVSGFWRGVLGRAVVPFVEDGEEEEKVAESAEDGMVLVRDVDLGRRW